MMVNILRFLCPNYLDLVRLLFAFRFIKWFPEARKIIEPQQRPLSVVVDWDDAAMPSAAREATIAYHDFSAWRADSDTHTFSTAPRASHISRNTFTHLAILLNVLHKFGSKKNSPLEKRSDSQLTSKLISHKPNQTYCYIYILAPGLNSVWY